MVQYQSSRRWRTGLSPSARTAVEWRRGSEPMRMPAALRSRAKCIYVFCESRPSLNGSRPFRALRAERGTRAPAPRPARKRHVVLAEVAPWVRSTSASQ